jgi:hypothetical protein
MLSTNVLRIPHEMQVDALLFQCLALKGIGLKMYEHNMDRPRLSVNYTGSNPVELLLVVLVISMPIELWRAMDQ